MQPPKKFRGEADTATLGEWLKSVVVYIDYYRAFNYFGNVHQEVATAVALLEGAAQDWWVTEGKFVVRNLEGLVDAMKRRFQTVADEELAARQLSRLSQGRDTVAVYTGKVLTLLGRIPTMDENTRLRMLMEGLRPDIRSKVGMLTPTSVHDAIKFANAAEVWSVNPADEGRKHTAAVMEEGGGGGSGGGGGAGVAPQYRDSTPPISRLGNHKDPSGSPLRSTEAYMAAASVAKCYRCGRHGHYASQCQEKHDLCYKCRKPGHIIKDCPEWNTKKEGGGAGGAGGRGGGPGGAGSAQTK